MFKSLHISRNQFLALLCFGAICYNSYLHFSSPAYKYYSEVSKELHDDWAKFRKTIEGDFIPTVIFAVTNSRPVAVSEKVSYTPFVNPSLPESLGIIDGKYWECGDKRGFFWDDRSFCVSDDFFGFPILGISPTMVTTTQGSFYLRKPPYYDKKEVGRQDD